MDSHGDEGSVIERIGAGKLKGALLCALFPVVAVFATRPFVEMGINDDFSYTQIALRLAQTGKLAYNGWNGPILGLQAYWAALFIKLCGFSFALVRFSTLPFAAGCTVLLYLIVLYVGLSRSCAVFLAFFVAFSPLAIPLEASFMSDIPAQFFLLLCVMTFLLATEPNASQAKTGLWIAVLTAAGLAGGTIRQFDFLVPAVFLPYIAWRSSGWRLRLWCAICGLATLIGALACELWFSHQTYAWLMPVLPQPWSSHAGYLHIADNVLGLVMEFAVLMTPVTVLYLFARIRIPRAGWLMLAAASVLVAAVLVLAAPHTYDAIFRQIGGNIVTDTGILGTGIEVIGDKPRTLPVPLQITLAAIGAGFLALAVIYRMRSVKNAGGCSVPAVTEWLRSYSARARVEHASVLFAFMYCALIGLRTLSQLAFDRYLLPLIVMAGILLPLWLPARLPIKLTAAWAFAFLFACYGVATTHDYFACSRARLRAAQMLTEANVPRRCISAGLEYDGWSQIALHGYINMAGILGPSDTYQSQAGRRYPISPPYWFWDLTPALEPAWLVVTSPQPGLSIMQQYQVGYHAWLPPFDRRVMVQAASDAETVCGQRPRVAPASADTQR